MWKYKLSALVLMNMCLVACKQNPNNLLEDARLKLNAANYISYDQSAFYPNPMGTINTLKASVVLKKNSSSFLGYDFLFQSNTTDDYFRNGEYRLVKKNEKIINIFPVEQADQMESSVRSGRNIQFSPMTFLNEDDWSYVNDTLQNTVRYSSFKRVETDTIIDGNEIYTALYIFINSKTKLMERFERRNFYRGELSQTVVYRYDDYSFGDDNMELTYTIPKDFVTVPFGQNDKDRITHNPGDSAPDFEGTDLNIRLIKKEDFQDKKLVLMFSVINCGYCKLAIENLTNDWYSEDHVSWAPDGESVYFISDRGDDLSVDQIEIPHNYNVDQSDIYSLNVDASIMNRLTNTAWNETYPTIMDSKVMTKQ